VTQRVKPHREREMISLAAQEWIRQGRAEGKIDSVLVALEARFGSVAPDIEGRIRQADPEQLTDLLRRACVTPSPDALFTDEARH